MKSAGWPGHLKRMTPESFIPFRFLHQELLRHNLAATYFIYTKFLMIHTRVAFHRYIYVHGQGERITGDKWFGDLERMLLGYHDFVVINTCWQANIRF